VQSIHNQKIQLIVVFKTYFVKEGLAILKNCLRLSQAECVQNLTRSISNPSVVLQHKVKISALLQMREMFCTCINHTVLLVFKVSDDSIYVYRSVFSKDPTFLYEFVRVKIDRSKYLQDISEYVTDTQKYKSQEQTSQTDIHDQHPTYGSVPELSTAKSVDHSAFV